LALTIHEQIKSGCVEIPSFTIEHILPDSQNRENAIIGNLMPLEEKLNRLCDDKPLNEKIQFYDSSSFVTARNIAIRYRDNVDNFNVEKRTTRMAKELYNEVDRIVNTI